MLILLTWVRAQLIKLVSVSHLDFWSCQLKFRVGNFVFKTTRHGYAEESHVIL